MRINTKIAIHSLIASGFACLSCANPKSAYPSTEGTDTYATAESVEPAPSQEELDARARSDIQEADADVELKKLQQEIDGAGQ